MKSLFKKFKNIALAFLGFAFIGGLSIACLPKLSHAKETFAEGEIVYFDESENNFYYLNGNQREYLSSMFCIDYSGNSISFEDGTATVVWKDDNLNSYSAHVENLVFSTSPTQYGQSYTGQLSGHLVEANSSFSNYPCPGPNIYYFDPNAVQWTWDGGAEDDFFYEYDYLNYFEQSTTYKAKFAAIDGAIGEDAIICEYTEGSQEAIFRTAIYASNASTGTYEYTGMSREFGFALTGEPRLDDSDNTYIFSFSAGDTTKSFHVSADYIHIVEGQRPEPPALNALEWYFNGDMGYFSTNPYTDNYYSFSLNTIINTAIYDRVNSTVTVNCTVTSDGASNMPEEYYDAEISFVYTFTEGGLVEDTWRFYNAVCDATIEETENIYFSPDVLSFRQLGWYYDEVLHYYVEEGIDATSWNVVHAEYRHEGSRNELALYMDVENDSTHIFPSYDIIQINSPSFDEQPYRGQSTLGTVVSGWSDKMQQYISVQCGYVPFGYYLDGWSYDAYSNELVYINANNIDWTYALTSAAVDGSNYILTYSYEGDVQSIIVSSIAYENEVLVGDAELVENSEPVRVSVHVPESMFDGGGDTSTGSWNYDSTNYTLIYYDESHGGSYNMTAVKIDSLNHIATITYRPTSATGGSPVTIEIQSVGDSSYDKQTNILTGLAALTAGSEELTEVSFYLQDLQGNRITIQSINSWAYNQDGQTVLWINEEGDPVYLDDENLNLYRCTFYETSDIDNQKYQYFVASYVYNNIELPQLKLTGASYTYNESYSVSGVFAENENFRVEGLIVPTDYWNPQDLVLYGYSIIFDGNGATSGSMPNDEFMRTEEFYDYVLPDCNYDRAGYNFAGWVTTPDGIMKRQPGTKLNVSSGETTIYAAWERSGYTVTFHANGGSGTMQPITVSSGATEIVPYCDFTYPGHTFVCWAVGSPTSSEKVYPDGQYSVTVTRDYDLYAIWESSGTGGPQIVVEDNEIVVYVGEEYVLNYEIDPKSAEVAVNCSVEDGRIVEAAADGDIYIRGLSAGTTTVTLIDENGLADSVVLTVYVIEPPEPVEPENKIDEQTISNINDELIDSSLDLSPEQINQIKDFIDDNKNYISDEAGSIVAEALGNTTIDSGAVYAEAQKNLVVTVVETGLMVDAGKATSISDAQEIDKALPDNAHFSVESEIDEFYQRQMVELFGGQMPSRLKTRAYEDEHEIDIDPKGREGDEAITYLENEESLYKQMVDYVDNSVDHMGKAALKLRKCSGESVVVQVKSYVTVVKVSSFREFDKEAADKEFVEAAYKAIMLSMQNEVISILEKEHKPSNNAEKEAQYKKELDAVKDYETFEIMVTEVLRQKYNALVEKQGKPTIDDVEEFKPIYDEIFEAWALDKQSKYGITLEELTQATIEQSVNRSRDFKVSKDLSTNEWVFIGAFGGTAVLAIAAAAIVPTVLKKKRVKEGIR